LKPRKSYPKKELNPALLRAEYEAGAMIEQLASKYKVAHQRITAAIREAGGTIRKRGGDDFGKKKNRFARLY
jgi:Mor family transcriptional regulator